MATDNATGKSKGRGDHYFAPAPERRGKVVDIFAALKQSLDQAATLRKPAAQERAAKPARKRRKA
jgi:non-homologous end joining protein Ku